MNEQDFFFYLIFNFYFKQKIVHIKFVNSNCCLKIKSYSPLVKSAYQKIIFLISQPKHVVGTQKNRLNETVLSSTQKIC